MPPARKFARDESIQLRDYLRNVCPFHELRYCDKLNHISHDVVAESLAMDCDFITDRNSLIVQSLFKRDLKMRASALDTKVGTVATEAEEKIKKIAEDGMKAAREVVKSVTDHTTMLEVLEAKVTRLQEERAAIQAIGNKFTADKNELRKKKEDLEARIVVASEQQDMAEQRIQVAEKRKRELDEQYGVDFALVAVGSLVTKRTKVSDSSTSC